MLGLNDARRAGLLGGTALALITTFGGQAMALDECGPAAAGTTITCTPAGNSFPNGIQYKVDDLTIVVQDGVVIDTTTKANEPGGVVSGGADNYGDLVVKAGTAGGAGVTITTDGKDADGIRAQSKDGDVSITSFADISVSGEDAWGIAARTDTGNAIVTSSGDVFTSGASGRGIYANSTAGAKTTIVSSGDVTTTGKYANAIIGLAGQGTVFIDATGDLSTSGKSASAIHAQADANDAEVHFAGTITTTGESSDGITIFADKGDGKVISISDITTTGKDSDGIFVAVGDGGDAFVTSTGNISVAGYGSQAIQANSELSNVTVTSTGRLITQGTYGDAINANAAGSITITHAGDISTSGNAGDGIDALAGGSITIISKANINIGGRANGILAYSTDATADVNSTGSIITVKDDSDGIFVFSKTKDSYAKSVGNIVTSGKSADGIRVEGPQGATILSTGSITTAGDYAVGLLAVSSGDAAYVTSTGNITTSGYSASAIAAYGSGNTRVVSVGNVATEGTGAEAIIAVSTTDAVVIQASGIVTARGNDTSAIFADAQGDNARVTTTGLVQATGEDAIGIAARAEVDVFVDAQNVLAIGEDGYAISVFSEDSKVSVTVRGTVLGGYDDAAGVYLEGDKGSSLRIEAGAVVGALNDFAVEQYTDDLTANNFGALVGGFYFNSGDDQFANFESGLVDLRQFADLDGDQLRDEEGVAFGNFGGDKDSFINNGVLRLASVAGATKWNTTGQILHPGGGNSDITQEGIEQGFITQLETFSHSGLITLSDGVAGDLLVITDQADGKTKGANVFTSDGGALALDVVLDDGSSKQSDVLILDKAETAGGGATRVLISNAGGIGGQTTGDGIMVVNVRDKSEADAFALGNNPVAGAYQYDLHYQNAAKTDENWYLRSSFFDGALEYPAIVSGALVTWYSDVGGLHGRLGQRRGEVAAQDALLLGQRAELPTATDVADVSAVRVNSSGDGGWFKVTGSDMDIEQDGPADFDLNSTRATAGFDVGFNNLFGETGDWLVLGALAGYGWSSVDFDSSKAEFDIATVGAYATYFRGPYYLDALVKFDWLDGSFSSDNVSQDGDVELPVFGLSLETGYRFDVTSGGLYLQPQAQLTYAHVGDDSFTDDSGAEIALQSADSLRGRLGARVGQELTSDSGAARGNFYLEASVNQEFLGETEAKVSGLTLEQELPGTTFEVGGGIDIALPKDGLTFTVDADYTLGDEAEGISATGGFRINW